MGFIYCPNCGQSISDQASISACPKCYHPFNKAEWQRVQAQKDAVVAEEKRKKQEKEQELNNAKQELNNVKESNKCPSCSAPISWEEKRGYSNGWNVDFSYTLQRPYCRSCGWKPTLAFEKTQASGVSNSLTINIVDWETAVKIEGHHYY
jgi:hypothetical protein